MVNQSQTCPVDGHVHFYDVDRVGPTLDAAAIHFQAVLEKSRAITGVLLLAQGAGERVFEDLRTIAATRGWQLTPVDDEPETLIASRNGLSIAIVCGQQLRASDGLEVLAIGTCRRLPDGRSFRDTLASVRADGSVAVVPWGFGKWLGARGERVQLELDSLGVAEAFVGDNGSRLAVLGRPRLVDVFERTGFRVLPGSDPFPRWRDCHRVGRFGFLAEAESMEQRPWNKLKQWLLNRAVSPVPYGRASGVGTFMLNQAHVRTFGRPSRRHSR